MSRKKPNRNQKQGWQKVEQPAKPAEPKPEPAPAAEPKAESKPEPKAESKPEPKPESKSKDAAQTGRKKKADKRRRKHSAAVPLGGFFILLALIGLITVVIFGVRTTESLIDNSKKKTEFGNFILPVLMFDPVPFEDPNEMGDLALLRSSIWAAIIENNERYAIGDGNMVSVPQSDVDVACAKLFGDGVTLIHQSFEDYLSIYSYNEENKTYYVPVDATILYTPQVEEIDRSGSTFELTVGYIAPDSQWMQTVKGEKSEPTPSKYMIYVLEQEDGEYHLTGIKDPPDGAVPGIPQIADNADQQTPAAPATESPQSIEPAAPEEQSEPETEQPAQQEESEDSESAQAATARVA
jgi:outer membrane biosynthesis protein TonB